MKRHVVRLLCAAVRPLRVLLSRPHSGRAVALAMLLSMTGAQALAQGASQAYPSRPIRMIVTFAPGSATDTVARIYGQKMAEILGQPVIVENRPGAVGTIGADAVAKAEPDGYTLLVGTNTTNAAVLSLLKHVPYDPRRDFTPITFLGVLPQVLIVNKDLPFTNVVDFVAYARANPDKLSYGWTNSVSRVSAELLAQMADVRFFNVPYKSGSTSIADLISGQINFTIIDMIVALPQIQSGTVRALAVTTPQRITQLPEVPSIAEALKLPGYEMMGIFALFGPANMPRDIVAKLNAAVVRASEDPELRSRFDRMSLNVQTTTPEQLRQRFEREIAVWTEIADKAGIKPE